MVGYCILWVTCQGVAAIAYAVRFEISLVHQVDTILVAEVVPHRVVRVVRGAYCVEVELLEQLQILYHSLAAHDVALQRVCLVAVYALDEDCLAIDEQLSILNLH